MTFVVVQVTSLHQGVKSLLVSYVHSAVASSANQYWSRSFQGEDINFGSGTIFVTVSLFWFCVGWRQDQIIAGVEYNVNKEKEDLAAVGEEWMI